MKKTISILITSLALAATTAVHADDAVDQPTTKEYTEGTVEYVSTNDFDQFIESGVVIVDFYADWCGPCKKLKPIFTQLAQSYKGKAKFAKVNIDHSRSVSKKYNVKKIPTVILFKDGKEIKRHGPGSKQDFIYWIDDSL